MTTYFIVLIFVSSSIIFGGTEVNSMSLMFNLRLASPIITTLRMWKRFELRPAFKGIKTKVI